MNRTVVILCAWALSLMVVSVVLVCGYTYLSRPSAKAAQLSQEALSLVVDRPETIKIIAVSTPDSIFGRQLLTDEERLAVAQNLMAVSNKMSRHMLSKDTLEDNSIGELVERQIKAATFMRTLNPEYEKGNHSGWKVKIEYEAISRNGNPYRSEYWFFLDKKAKFIYDSFEIPLL